MSFWTTRHDTTVTPEIEPKSFTTVLPSGEKMPRFEMAFNLWAHLLELDEVRNFLPFTKQLVTPVFLQCLSANRQRKRVDASSKCKFGLSRIQNSPDHWQTNLAVVANYSTTEET